MTFPVTATNVLRSAGAVNHLRVDNWRHFMSFVSDIAGFQPPISFGQEQHEKMRLPAFFIRPDILLLLKFKYIVKGQPVIVEDAQGNITVALKTVSKGSSKNVLNSQQHHQTTSKRIIFGIYVLYLFSFKKPLLYGSVSLLSSLSLWVSGTVLYWAPGRYLGARTSCLSLQWWS